ncbi:hypothetical protein RIN67_02960 [Levilactobacillus namurensis]|uniref:hypothetical protein n=1 Tax=Levilactobacillus namurensis TaxID=380393 RepID=UPI0004666D89|nr:hypothetical protein [Levilactobacillus namurensis]MDT7019331.1 hypothetical protein [Levilactobacillus namurensis]WNN66069.1 hypothetical protein RIN67_02960 [Levilactobacillus namurensis]
MDDLLNSLTRLFRQAYEQGVEDGRKERDHRFIKRAEMQGEFGIPVDTFDSDFRGKPGFPTYRFGTAERYYIPAVSQWILEHQERN